MGLARLTHMVRVMLPAALPSGERAEKGWAFAWVLMAAGLCDILSGRPPGHLSIGRELNAMDPVWQ